MTSARVTGLRSVELGVPDLEKSADFYRNVWGLEDVLATGDTIHIRRTDHERAFFTDAPGFRLSDSPDMMEFVRCTSDHHSLALVRTEGPSLNHMAYEMPNVDGLMRGAGRLKQHGFNIEWGVGRHGPGNNVFTYFVEPNGFVTEYTAAVDQADEATP